MKEEAKAPPGCKGLIESRGDQPLRPDLRNLGPLGGKLSRTTAAESKKSAEVTERARLLQSEVANLMADHATKEKVVRQLEEKVVTLESQTIELSGMREELHGSCWRVVERYVRTVFTDISGQMLGHQPLFYGSLT